MAPTKGGIRNDPSTTAWMVRRHGTSVRDTPQASGTAITAAMPDAAIPSRTEFQSACTYRARPNAAV